MLKNAITIIVILNFGVMASLCSPPGEEGKVKKQFHVLSGWVSKDDGEKVLTAARKIRNIGTHFTPECILKTHIDSYSGTYTPEEISEHAAAARSRFSKVSLRFYDFDVDFLEEGTARVTVTARLTGASTTGDRIDDAYELECVLKRTEDKWLFTQVVMVEVLKK